MKSLKRGTPVKSLITLWASRIYKGDILYYLRPYNVHDRFDFIVRNKHGHRILMNWSEVEILDHQERLTYLYRRT
jgi:hypothetical protein